MAKSRTETINKSQAIRDALQAHPERSPSEIAEQLKAKGLDVNAQYVSTSRATQRRRDARWSRDGNRDGWLPGMGAPTTS